MTTLSIDTATDHLVLGLESENLALERSIPLGRSHAERIAQETAALFASSGLEFRAERIVLGLGPGSYTGLRVGASYARGLARAWHAPMLGVSTLEGVAAGHEGRVAAALEARKGNMYGGIYRVEAGQIAEVLLEEGKLERSLFLGQAERLGATVLEGTPPGGLALIQVARARGRADAPLQYL